MIETITVEVEVDKQKRIGYNKNDFSTVSFYAIKPHALRSVLNSMEVDDLKNMCRFLDLKLSGSKKDLVKRLWLCDKIKRIGFITQ